MSGRLDDLRDASVRLLRDQHDHDQSGGEYPDHCDEEAKRATGVAAERERAKEDPP